MSDAELNEALEGFATDFRYLETMLQQAHREIAK